MYLGYIELVDKSTQEPLKQEEQLKFIFIPQDKFDFRDKCPRYSYFERDFLLPAIKSINYDISKDINNLRISRKTKTGRRITHLEFKFNALGKDLTIDEKKCLQFFETHKLEREQIIFLIKRIGHKEMYGRWMRSVEKRVYDDDKIAKFYERETQKEITNISGYLYSILFPELKKD
jgi:hypothetical protein